MLCTCKSYSLYPNRFPVSRRGHIAYYCPACASLEGFCFFRRWVILWNLSFVVFICVQMCFRCTKSSICGTHCCWVTPLSPSASAWPYCSNSGTVSWLMASMSASYSSLTCQVRIWACIYITVNVFLFSSAFHTRTRTKCYLIINSSIIAYFMFIRTPAVIGENHTEILFSGFHEPDAKVVRLSQQLAFAVGSIFSLSVLMCSDVFALMISSKQAALHSYTDIVPPRCAPGMARSALHQSTHCTLGIVCHNRNHNLCGSPAYQSLIIFIQSFKSIFSLRGLFSHSMISLK